MKLKKFDSSSIIVTIIFLAYFSPFIIIFLSYTLGNVFSNVDLSNDYARITDVSYKAVVDDSPGSYGRIHVTERLTFDLHAASESNPFWELWRELPESTIDGADVRYKVSSVKQILSDGTEIAYQEAPKVYYYDSDYTDSEAGLGPYKWFHSPGPYDEEEELYESLMIYIDGVYRDTMVFEIEYEMYNAALRYGDCSELYLSMYSGDTIKYLNHYKAEILFPNEIMPREGNYTVHTLGTNSNSFPYEKSTTVYPNYTTFTMELDKDQLQFKKYNQYVEFTLVAFGDDKYSFTKHATINSYYSNNVLDEVNKEINYYQNLPKQYHNIKIVVFTICLLLCYYAYTKAIKRNQKIREKYTFYEPTIHEGYYRDIPSNLDPLFAAHIAFVKDDPDRDMKDIYAALLLSLARKKYVELVKVNPNSDWKPNNTKIVVKYKPEVVAPVTTNNFTTATTTESTAEATTEQPAPVAPVEEGTKKYEELSPNEKEYLNLILKHCTGDEITLAAFQTKIANDYTRTDNFVTSLENSKTTIGVNGGYYQTAKYTEVRDTLQGYKTFAIVKAVLLGIFVNSASIATRLDLAFGGFTALAIAEIACAFEYSKYIKNSLLLTQFGQDESNKWRGLYEFLNSETLMKERTVIELPLWEQYLVYATAFGISEKVIKAIQIRCPEANQSPILSNNSAYHSSHFYSSGRAIRTASHSASSFSQCGGAGGYGGGGRGGGGGGGGH